MDRHPCEFFIKYLITLPNPESQDDNWVKLGVQNFGFPPPEDRYLNMLRAEVYNDLPVNYNPRDRYNRPSVKFLRKHQIWSLHNPDEAIRQALLILPNYRVRKLIEHLLLGRLDAKDVAKKVNSRLNVYFTADVIRAYGHYYWNCTVMKTQDWVDFFGLYDNAEKSKSLAILSNGPAMALHATGFQQHLESKEMLREMQEALYFDFRDWKEQPRSPVKTNAMTNIVKAASQVDVRLSEADSALRESLKAFEQFRMEHARRNVRSIDEIAPHGNFSESGADIKELPPAPEEEEKKAS